MEYEFRNFSSSELVEYSRLSGRAEDAMAVGDYDAADYVNDKMEKMQDKAEKRAQESAKNQLRKEAKEVMKLPLSQRNEHYAKVKKEHGSKAAIALVSEVRKQRELNQVMER